MTDKLRRLIPVGFSAKPAFCLYISGYIISVLISVGEFLRKFIVAYESITEYENGIQIYIDNSYIKEFVHVRGDSFYMFKLYVGLLLAFSLYCVVSHFIGSKSIYTMLRLKNPFELFIRCALMTTIMLMICIFTIIALNGLFLGIYIHYVPDEHLLPWWDEYIWRNLL